MYLSRLVVELIMSNKRVLHRRKTIARIRARKRNRKEIKTSTHYHPHGDHQVEQSEGHKSELHTK